MLTSTLVCLPVGGDDFGHAWLDFCYSFPPQGNWFLCTKGLLSRSPSRHPALFHDVLRTGDGTNPRAFGHHVSDSTLLPDATLRSDLAEIAIVQAPSRAVRHLGHYYGWGLGGYPNCAGIKLVGVPPPDLQNFVDTPPVPQRVSKTRQRHTSEIKGITWREGIPTCRLLALGCTALRVPETCSSGIAAAAAAGK